MENSQTLDMNRSQQEEDEVEARDWSNLNVDILETIIKRLNTFEHLKFGGVCGPWRSIRSLHRNHTTYRPKSPLLMLDSSSLSFHRHFLNPFGGSRYTFTLYELFAEKCIGSSGSWLIMKGLDHYIYNPFTLTKIMLPKNEPYFYEPIIALSKPATPQFSLIAFTGYPRSLHFIRQNEKKWSSYNYNLDVNTEEIIQAMTLNGKFYAMSSRGRLAFIDLDRDMVLEWKDDIARIKFDLRREHVYFLESNKEILLVIVACAKLKQNENMQACRVFKLDMATSRWIDAKHIMKDQSDLFLGPRGSISVEAKEQGYRVYTAGEESFGMLDLRSGEGRICCDHDERKKNNFWVMPELLFRDRDPKWWAALYNMNDRLLDRVYAVLFMLLLLSSFSLPLIFCVVILYLMVMFWALWTSLCNENE